MPKKKRRAAATKKAIKKATPRKKSIAPKRATRAPVKPTRRPKASATPRAGAKNREWQLRLYVAGQTPKSISAFANLKRICDEHLAGRYRIEIVDLMENPTLARGDQIVAIPTLVRRLPHPVRKIIGDLSNTERVLVGLQLLPG